MVPGSPNLYELISPVLLLSLKATSLFLLPAKVKKVSRISHIVTRLHSKLGTVLLGHYSTKVFKFSPDSRIVEIQGPKRLELSLERDP